jgi:hypothetical protein
MRKQGEVAASKKGSHVLLFVQNVITHFCRPTTFVPMRVTLILSHSLLHSFLKILKLIFFITIFLLNPFPSLGGCTGIDLASCLFISLVIFIDSSCHFISHHFQVISFLVIHHMFLGVFIIIILLLR